MSARVYLVHLVYLIYLVRWIYRVVGFVEPPLQPFSLSRFS